MAKGSDGGGSLVPGNRKVVAWAAVGAAVWYGQEGAPGGVGMEVSQPMVAVNMNKIMKMTRSDSVSRQPSPVTTAPPKPFLLHLKLLAHVIC